MTTKNRPRFVSMPKAKPKKQAEVAPVQFKPVAELETLLVKRKHHAIETLPELFRIGQLCSMVQKQAMLNARTNIPKGPRYTKAWRAMTEYHPEVRAMKPPERSKAIHFYNKRESIEAWFSAQKNRQYDLNSIGSILNAWRRDENKTAEKKTKQIPGTRTKTEDVEAVVLKVSLERDEAIKQRDQYLKQRDHYKADLDVVHDKLDKANKLIASLKAQLKRKS